MPCALLRYKWCDEYEKKLREVWVTDPGQNEIKYHDNWITEAHLDEHNQSNHDWKSKINDYDS